MTPKLVVNDECKVCIGEIREKGNHLIAISRGGKHYGTIRLVTEECEEVVMIEEQKVQEDEDVGDLFPFGYDYGHEVPPQLD